MEPSAEIALPATFHEPVRRRFIAYHKWDRNFFLAFLALCWLGVLMGFTPAAMKRYAGHADYPAPLILEIHAFAFCAWMILLTTQIALIRARRPRLHMKLGLAGFALVPVMAISGALSELFSQRFRLNSSAGQPGLFNHPDFLCRGLHLARNRRAAGAQKPCRAQAPHPPGDHDYRRRSLWSLVGAVRSTTYSATVTAECCSTPTAGPNSDPARRFGL